MTTLYVNKQGASVNRLGERIATREPERFFGIP